MMELTERLNKLLYTTVNRHNTIIRKWYFYKNDNLYFLSHENQVYNILSRNKYTTYNKSVYYVRLIDNHQTYCEAIYDIDKWLEEHIELLEKSADNFVKSKDIIEYVNNEIGEYCFAISNERGWYVAKLLKLTIDVYSLKITLNHKNKDTIISEKKLKTFIQKNKKIILQTKENNNKERLNRIEAQRENIRLEKLKQENEKQNVISTKAHDATKKVGMKRNCTSFSIHRTLKERYETQACKPLPVNYPWVE